MIRRDMLLDTGPLVAVLDPTDQWHARCVDVWPDLADRCVTTEAVVAEASYLMLRGRARAYVPLDFLLTGGIPIAALDVGGHRRAVRLMARYQDLPMDYGDASLVVVAEALGIHSVFTTDRRGFSTYAPARGTRYKMLPET